MRIWTAHLDQLSTARLAELESLLDETERARAARFHFARDRRHYVAARGLLRERIGCALDVSPTSVQFSIGPRGKPSAAQTNREDRSLRFNLSHSAGWAIFAVSWDHEVGIDLESRARLTANSDEHLSGLAARVLSARELSLWRALPDAAARHSAFIRAWTRKEAYAKATGAGVFDGLREIEVILDAAAPEPSLIITQPCDRAPNGWTLHDLDAPDGFAAALAVERPRG